MPQAAAVNGPDSAFSRNCCRINVFTPCPPAAVLPFPNGNGKGTRKKSKSLPHNKFTHVNAPVAPGIPAAPEVGMTCRGVNPVRKHRS